MSKMIIMGSDGKPRYELDDSNNITNLREYCTCSEEYRPEQRDGEKRVCLICNKKIV